MTDVQGGTLPAVDIVLTKALTGLERRATTGIDGTFQIVNIPLDGYVLRVELGGFAPQVREVDLRTSIPVDLRITLDLAAQSSSVIVRADDPALVDATSAGTRNQISMARIEQLPSAVGSRGLESALVTFPGFAQNANGAIHPRGAHNQMTFVVDGLPIGDQLTGAFANALDAAIVQTAELMTGNIPAEFGGKVSGVAVVTSRSGLGISRRAAGDVTGTGAGFGTWHGVAQAGGGGRRAGYFGSIAAMRTERFLDQVSLSNLHNAGSFSRGFGRVDLVLTERDTLRVHAMGGTSQFDIANLRSQHAAGQDQRQQLADAAGWASYLRTLDTQSTLESTVGYRATSARLSDSPGDTPVTASQWRTLSTLTAATRYTRVVGAHTVRAGADFQHFPVTERFSMGITSPAFNGPDTASYQPTLEQYDLTRGGTRFTFDDSRAGRTWSAFGQSTVRLGPATLAIGLRHDTYRFLVNGAQLQPRLGIAYRLPGSHGVVRASYNRNYQTPPNENLLLSSSPAAARLAPASVAEALGGGFRPIQPERQNVLEAGFQRAIGSRASVDVSAYRKTSRDQQDNNNFFDTGIIFPTTLAKIVVEGAEARLTMAARRVGDTERHDRPGDFIATVHGRPVSRSGRGRPPVGGALCDRSRPAAERPWDDPVQPARVRVARRIGPARQRPGLEPVGPGCSCRRSGFRRPVAVRRPGSDGTARTPQDDHRRVRRMRPLGGRTANMGPSGASHESHRSRCALQLPVGVCWYTARAAAHAGPAGEVLLLSPGADRPRQRRGIVDDPIGAFHPIAPKAEAVRHGAAARRGAPGRFEADPRVAHHQCVGGGRTGALHQVEERRRVGLAAERAVAADHFIEQVANAQAFKDPLARADRLVCQHDHTAVRARGSQHLGNAVVQVGVVQQALVVDLEESRQGAGRVRQARRDERTADEHAGTFAHHAGDRFHRQRRSPELGDQLVGRISEVAPGLDQRAVEVERDQAPV